MSYTYKELCKDLDIGHEMHFKYKGKEYSISHNNEGSYLSVFHGEHQSFTDHVELLQNGTIEGKILKDIWDDVEVINIF